MISKLLSYDCNVSVNKDFIHSLFIYDEMKACSNLNNNWDCSRQQNGGEGS